MKTMNTFFKKQSQIKELIMNLSDNYFGEYPNLSKKIVKFLYIFSNTL